MVAFALSLYLFSFGKEKKEAHRKTQLTKQITLITTYREKELAYFFFLCVFLNQSVCEK